MNDKEKMKDIFFLIVSVGLIVPLWGTFHNDIGIKTAWAAFAAAALFFAAGHKIEDSPKIAVGHVIGVGWGIALFTLLNRPEFQLYDVRLTAFAVLFVLGVLAVIVTHLNIDIISHLPSLFCGWAISVGAIGGIPAQKWSSVSIDVILSLIAGVFIIGVGISQLHCLLIKLVKTDTKDNDQKTVEKTGKIPKEKGENVTKAEAKILKFTNAYRSSNQKEDILSKKDLSEIKNEIIKLKSTLSSSSFPLSSNLNYSNSVVKIVGICGSPHTKGSTIAYVKKALEAAASIGNVETELIELAGKEIKPCMGCRTDKCYGKCKINDAMQEIYPILQGCDGIVIGSPSYFGTFTGQLKLFLDRLRVMRHTDFQLGNKVVAPLAVAGRRHGGQEITNLDLIQSMIRHNTIIVNDGTAVCQLGATGWSHTFDDPNNKAEDDSYGLQTAEGVGKRVAEIAKVIKASGLQHNIYKYNAKIGKR